MMLLPYLLRTTAASSSSRRNITMFVMNSIMILLLMDSTSAFYYVPGVNPLSFGVGELIKVKVNKLTSSTTLLPIDYYHLPFCYPSRGPYMDNQNLGEFLAGDRIQSSSYKLLMKQEMYCEQVCITNLGRGERPGIAVNKVVRAIKNQYHHNWILDNLDAGYIQVLPTTTNLTSTSETTTTTRTTHYSRGFPIGFIHESDQKAYIYNHVNIEVMYSPVDNDKYRVVRFTVEPFSIRHDFVPLSEEDEENSSMKATTKKWATIRNPIQSCSIPSNTSPGELSERVHTNYDMVTGPGQRPQVASGATLFTYDVHWVESTNNVNWPSRWDIYLERRQQLDEPLSLDLSMKSLYLSVILVCILTATIQCILIRNLKQTLARSNKDELLATTKEEEMTKTTEEKSSVYKEEEECDEEQGEDDTEDDEEEETEMGWRVLRAEVFRPPATRVVLFCAACGTGAQLLVMTFGVIVLCALGLVNPARRGSLIQTGLLLYALLGARGGYVTARLHKALTVDYNDNDESGKNLGIDKARRLTTRYTAFGFPGLCFVFLFLFDLLNLLPWYWASTYAVPLVTLLVVLFLWLCIATPMVYLGAHFGYKFDAMEFPTDDETSSTSTSNSTHSSIPHQAWYHDTIFLGLLGGSLPFALCFVELSYIMESLWMGDRYYMYGLLLLVFTCLILTCAKISTLLTYYQLCHGNSRWWWRAFGTAGSTSIYIFLYSIVYFFQPMEANSSSPSGLNHGGGRRGPTTYILYFTFMILTCLAFFLMTGYVGVVSSLWFNMRLLGGGLKGR